LVSALCDIPEEGSLIYTAAAACSLAFSEIWTWWKNEKVCTALESNLCRPALSQCFLQFQYRGL